MGKRGKGGGTGGKTKQKSLLDGDFDFAKYPQLKKPLEEVGKAVNVPGSYWDKCPDADKNKLFKCVIRDFSIAHRSAVGPVSPAYQMQEMGERGTGSLEQGDSSGEVFWMHSPEPFLKYYYATYPDELQSGATTGGAQVADADQPPGTAEAAEAAQVKRLMLYSFVDLQSDKLVTTGKYTGFHEWNYQCNIDFGGHVCGTQFTLRAPEGKAPNTGNISRHLMNFVERCPHHRAAYEQFLETSKNVAQDSDGKWVSIFSFEEAFPHHVNFVWMHAEGLVSAHLAKRESFRTYIRGFEPRARFPHHVTIHRLAEVIEEEQREERRARHAKLMASFMGFECIGLQLDMWTDTTTHVAYAAVNATTILEPKGHVSPTSLQVKSETPGASSSTSPPMSKTPSASSSKPPPQRPPQLSLQSEVLDFEQFPFTEHTGENIAKWLKALLIREGITYAATAGVSPDGAADGQCAMASIEDLGEKTDTCDLHRFQRAILAALGLSGASSKSPESKLVLRKNGRVVTLSIQSRAVSDGIHDAQVEQDIPPHKILTTVQTMVTRWGNQKQQVSRNIMLRPVLDAVIDKYKRENKNNKEAIVESNDSEQGSKVGKAMAATEIGLSSDDWDKTMELNGLLDQPFAIKETIEHGSKAGPVAGPVTGAQSLIMMSDQMSNCDLDAPLAIAAYPPTATLKDRMLAVEERPGSQLSSMIDTARSVLKEELDSRFFVSRPSNTRLVQCYMSKQKPISSYLDSRMVVLAETLYKSWIRRAATIAGIATRSSPPRAKKTKIGGVFRAISLPADAHSPTGDLSLEFDTVTDEIQRWKDLSCDRIEPFTENQGLVNEFALMWNVKDSFPLHYTVFKQTAVHIPHEANVEQVFSTAGRLADTHTNPRHLARLVMIARNKKIYKPETKKLLSKYFQKFSKAGQLEFEESTLGLEIDEAQDCGEE